MRQLIVQCVLHGRITAKILSLARTQSLVALGVYPLLWHKIAVLWPIPFLSLFVSNSHCSVTSTQPLTAILFTPLATAAFFAVVGYLHLNCGS